jgi:hypothetical protein
MEESGSPYANQFNQTNMTDMERRSKWIFSFCNLSEMEGHQEYFKKLEQTSIWPYTN